MNATNLTLKQRAYHGLKHYLFISCYLWLVFALFVLYKSVILAEPISFVANGFALLNALALGKVILIAQEFHLADDQFKEAPLIYPTLFKSFVFAMLLGLFKVIEEALVGLYHGRSFTESVTKIGGGTVAGILSMMAILFVLLIPFFGFTELRRVFGEDKLEKLFLTSRSPGDAA